jgi:ethanolamine utilization protein EutQ (cupin superfamily)
MCVRKKTGKEIVLQPLRDGVFTGSNIAEIFDASGRTKMSCGIHEIFASEVTVEKAPVDDVLYVLEGEIEIEADGATETFRAGDFAYLRAGARQRFIVRDRVKHIYVCYPGNWKQDAPA